MRRPSPPPMSERAWGRASVRGLARLRTPCRARLKDRRNRRFALEFGAFGVEYSARLAVEAASIGLFVGGELGGAERLYLLGNAGGVDIADID